MHCVLTAALSFAQDADELQKKASYFADPEPPVLEESRRGSKPKAKSKKPLSKGIAHKTLKTTCNSACKTFYKTYLGGAYAYAYSEARDDQNRLVSWSGCVPEAPQVEQALKNAKKMEEMAGGRPRQGANELEYEDLMLANLNSFEKRWIQFDRICGLLESDDPCHIEQGQQEFQNAIYLQYSIAIPAAMCNLAERAQLIEAPRGKWNSALSKFPLAESAQHDQAGQKGRQMGRHAGGSACLEELPDLLLHTGGGPICDQDGNCGHAWVEQRRSEVPGARDPRHGWCPLDEIWWLNKLLDYRWKYDKSQSHAIPERTPDSPQWPNVTWDTGNTVLTVHWDQPLSVDSASVFVRKVIQLAHPDGAKQPQDYSSHSCAHPTFT